MFVAENKHKNLCEYVDFYKFVFFTFISLCVNNDHFHVIYLHQLMHVLFFALQGFPPIHLYL